jgi:hypothetical protein
MKMSATRGRRGAHALEAPEAPLERRMHPHEEALALRERARPVALGPDDEEVRDLAPARRRRAGIAQAA